MRRKTDKNLHLRRPREARKGSKHSTKLILIYPSHKYKQTQIWKKKSKILTCFHPKMPKVYAQRTGFRRQNKLRLELHSAYAQ